MSDKPKKEQGQHSKRGQALMLDLRDHTFKLLKEGNIEEDKARQIANELVIIISKHWGGQQLYITKPDSFLNDKRDLEIYKKCNGHNHSDLAQIYDLAVPYIYRIVKRIAEIERKRKQPDLFE